MYSGVAPGGVPGLWAKVLTSILFFLGSPVVQDIETEVNPDTGTITLSCNVIGSPPADLSYFQGQTLIDPNAPPEGHTIRGIYMYIYIYLSDYMISENMFRTS